jgi:hypothetical protein
MFYRKKTFFLISFLLISSSVFSLDYNDIKFSVIRESLPVYDNEQFGTYAKMMAIDYGRKGTVRQFNYLDDPSGSMEFAVNAARFQIFSFHKWERNMAWIVENDLGDGMYFIFLFWINGNRWEQWPVTCLAFLVTE